MNDQAGDAAKNVGLTRCQRCECAHFYVGRTMQISGGRIKRYRYCRNCGHGKVTIELSVAELARLEKPPATRQ